jgi:hypothetical protein
VYAPHLQLRSFDGISEEHRFAILQLALNVLTAANIAWLWAHPETPLLYESGIRYSEEPPGVDEWLDIPECLFRHRRGLPIDCEDLACWRVAELRVRYGEHDATHEVTVADLPDSRTGDIVTTFHIAVRRGAAAGLVWDGTQWVHRIEDPSRRLGMK